MIPADSRVCESGWMRKGIEVRLDPGDRERLEAVIGSGNSPQKHVWRARIVLLSAAGVGTMAIQRQRTTILFAALDDTALQNDAVEGFFAKLRGQSLKRGVFKG